MFGDSFQQQNESTAQKRKQEVSFKTSEHKNWGNADKKLEAMIETYPMMLILLLPAVLLFVLMLRWLFENQRNNKWNCRLSDNDQNIRMAEALIIKTPPGNQTELILCYYYCLLFSFLCCCWKYCFNKNSTPKLLTQN